MWLKIRILIKKYEMRKCLGGNLQIIAYQSLASQILVVELAHEMSPNLPIKNGFHQLRPSVWIIIINANLCIINSIMNLALDKSHQSCINGKVGCGLRLIASTVLNCHSRGRNEETSFVDRPRWVSTEFWKNGSEASALTTHILGASFGTTHVMWGWESPWETLFLFAGTEWDLWDSFVFYSFPLTLLMR